MPPRHAPKGTPVGGMRNLNARTPYLEVVDDPRATHGRGSTQPTLFGVIGRTRMDPYHSSLQDIVMNTKASAPVPGHLISDKGMMAHHQNTERMVVSHAPATSIPGIHHGQVPYPGHFMSAC